LEKTLVLKSTFLYNDSKSQLLPEQKDTIAAILGASAALAGLLLVFVGFVYARGESSYNTRLGVKFKIAAKFGLAPFVVSLVCTSCCTEWMVWRPQFLFAWSIRTFEATIVLTALYGSVIMISFL
jgi:hypothetical protein